MRMTGKAKTAGSLCPYYPSPLASSCATFRHSQSNAALYGARQETFQHGLPELPSVAYGEASPRAVAHQGILHAQSTPGSWARRRRRLSYRDLGPAGAEDRQGEPGTALGADRARRLKPEPH